MSTQTRALYYPNLLLTVTETRFGSKKLLSPKNPYEVPLVATTKKIIVKADKLVCLKEVWGRSILLNRSNIYILVSGDTDDDTYKSVLCSYYKTHRSFANFVDKVRFFSAQGKPFIECFNDSIRRELRNYTVLVDSTLRYYKGTKFLLEDNEYLYYAVEPMCDLWDLEGVTIIR